MKIRGMRFAGLMIFALGVLFGLTLLALAIWGDMEASAFDPAWTAERPVEGFSCPVLITQDEVGVITARISNPLERKITPLVLMHVSDGYLTMMRESVGHPEIAPAQTATYRWEVGKQDAAWGRLILARLYVSAEYPLPSRGAFCGVVVANLPWLRGGQVVGLLLLLSLVGMMTGLFLWRRSISLWRGRWREVTYAMGALAGVLILGIVASLWGQWFLGVLLAAVAVLLIAILALYYFLGGMVAED